MFTALFHRGSPFPFSCLAALQIELGPKDLAAAPQEPRVHGGSRAQQRLTPWDGMGTSSSNGMWGFNPCQVYPP